MSMSDVSAMMRWLQAGATGCQRFMAGSYTRQGQAPNEETLDFGGGGRVQQAQHGQIAAEQDSDMHMQLQAGH